MLSCPVLRHFAGALIAVADGPQGGIAQDLFHFRVGKDGDLGMIPGAVCHRLGAGKVILSNENVHMAGILGQKYRLFRCGKAAADDENLFPGEEFTVAGGAVGNAPAPEVRFSIEADHSGMGAGGKQDAEGFQLATAGPDGFEIALHLQAFHLRQHELRSEGLRLAAHGLGELRAAGALDAGIVHDFMGNGDLAAEFFFFHYDNAVFGSCQVQGGRQARRPAADDDNVI